MRRPDLGPLRYEPFEQLADRPHVMVDGAARAASIVTLSHWPRSPTPEALARDLSVEIVLATVRAGRGSLPSNRAERRAVAKELAAAATAEAVTNDHFDEDGLMSIAALAQPDLVLRHAEVAVAVGRCGDFGVVESTEAAQISFSVGPLADESAGPSAGTSERYAAMLERLPHLLEAPSAYEPYFRPEMDEYLAGVRAIEEGRVSLREDGRLDLAVVSRTDSSGSDSGRLAGASGGLPVHEAAVNTATPSSRLLAFDGARCQLTFRYEGWVRYVSRRIPLRPALEPLAAELTALEPGGIVWEANPVEAIVGHLGPAGEGVTELAPAVVEATVRGYLERAPGAFDPWAGTARASG